MKWEEIKITWNGSNNELLVDLIADLFYTLGTKGVVIDDPQIEIAEEWGSDAVARPSQPAVTGYLPLDDRFDRNRSTITRSLNELAKSNHIQFKLTTRFMEEKDWAESWKKFFKPQKITERIVVRPTWHDYETLCDELDIKIDPGMAFGTGSHPTTALCIQMLEKYLQSGDDVLDVGTGSGILLVVAAKLGARRLSGVDNDITAVRVARDNLLLNSVHQSMIDLHCGHLADSISHCYDVLVANILAAPVIELLNDVRRLLHPGGLFICSGIIESGRFAVEEKMKECGMTILQVAGVEEWVALVGRVGTE